MDEDEYIECKDRACWLVLPNVDSGCQQSGDNCEQYNMEYEEYGNIAHTYVIELMRIRGV